MEKKLVKPYDKELMRMAMLKHEETFKEQVSELHRLYRIQKVLMKNSGRGKAKNEIRQAAPMELDFEEPVNDYITEAHGNGILQNIDESEIELTLGPASYNQRKKKYETPINSDSGHSFSSSSTGSSHINRNRTKRGDLGQLELGLVQVPNMTPRYQRGNINNVGVEENSRQERLNQAPWLLQVLSLSMT